MGRKNYKAGEMATWRAIWWIITAIAVTAVLGSLTSILFNQFMVNWYVYLTLLVGVIAVILLIRFRKFTTNETLAFKKK